MLTGTHKSTFAGVPATNKKVHWHSCNVIEVKNGKAISHRIYADNVSLMRQLGVLPVPKAWQRDNKAARSQLISGQETRRRSSSLRQSS